MRDVRQPAIPASRPAPAAASDHVRAGLEPSLKQFWRKLDHVVPLEPPVCRAIEHAAPVGVGDERKVGRASCIGQKRLDMLRRRAVRPTAVRRSVRVTARTASVIGVPSLRWCASRQQTCPRLGSGNLPQELSQDCRLTTARDRLDRQQVRLRVEHGSNAATLFVADLVIGRAAVVTRVFRVVAPDDAVSRPILQRTSRGLAVAPAAQAPRSARSDASPRLRRYRRGRALCSWRGSSPRSRRPRRHRRRSVGGDDLIRVITQNPSRPEAVPEVVPLRLELRGEAAVEHDDVTIDGVRETHHTSIAAGDHQRPTMITLETAPSAWTSVPPATQLADAQETATSSTGTSTVVHPLPGVTVSRILWAFPGFAPTLAGTSRSRQRDRRRSPARQRPALADPGERPRERRDTGEAAPELSSPRDPGHRGDAVRRRCACDHRDVCHRSRGTRWSPWDTLHARAPAVGRVAARMSPSSVASTQRVGRQDAYVGTSRRTTPSTLAARPMDPGC